MSEHLPPLQKPHWLPPDEWRQLLALHGNAPRCAVCGTTDSLSVDHIQSRKYGGSDDLANLQFLCIPHNSQKGIAEDGYWGRTFYWDRVPNLNPLRTAQSRLYEALVRDPEVSAWFSQPPNVTAYKLYINAWVVSAGKTLAIPVTAFAYNQLQRLNWPACRRADRILILTKEQSNRDQIADALRSDMVKFRIVPEAPRIGTVEKYDYLRDDGWLRRFDALVACVQMFWDANHQPKPDMVEILGKFTLIFIDEPHFGPNQVRKILDSTPRSVVFGLTGSPIKRDASLLRDYVALTNYTYQDSHRHDAGVKHLNDDSVTTVYLDSADLLVAGSKRSINDASDPDYDVSQLVPAANVASAVIREMERCDAVMLGDLAPHRHESFKADLWYPGHSIIRCNNMKMADTLAKMIQEHFEENRRRYPKAAGWNVESIFIGDDEIPGQRLDPETHPWLRSWRKGIDERTMQFTCDTASARVLVVVGMAREGVNNPLCCITASVDGTGSIVMTVQGLIGRALRSVLYVDPDGVVHVPPAPLDTVRILVHDAHKKTRAAIDAGIDFVLNMDAKLEGLPSIGDLINGHAPTIPVDPASSDDPLTTFDYVAIAVDAWNAGGHRWRHDEDLMNQIIDAAAGRYAPNNEAKAKRVKDWISGPLREDPERAWRMTGHVDIEELPSVNIVLDERERHNLTDEQLADFIRWNAPGLAEMAENPSLEILRFMREMHKRWADDRVLPQPRSDERLEDIRQMFTRQVKDFLKPYVKDWKGFQDAAHKHVGIAVKQILNVPRGQSAGKGTQWDCPQVHVVLHRPDIKRAIQGYARSQLINDGWCPVLAHAFGVNPDG